MREAPALAGVTGTRPRPAAPRPPKPRGSKPQGRNSLLGRAFARPGVTVAGAAFAALMTVIVVNAAFLQKGHRPTSLFGVAHRIEPRPLAAPAALPATASATVAPLSVPVISPSQALAPQAPSQISAPAAVAKPAPAAAAKPAVLHSDHAKATAAHKHDDSIARLLGGLSGDAHAGVTPKAAATSHVAGTKAKAQGAKIKPAVAVGAAAPQD